MDHSNESLAQRITVVETQLKERQDHLTHVVEDIKRATADGDDTVFSLVREQNSRLSKVETELGEHLRQHEHDNHVLKGKRQAFSLIYEIGQHWWKAGIGVIAVLEGMSKAGWL